MVGERSPPGENCPPRKSDLVREPCGAGNMNDTWITDALERYEAPLLRYATRLSGCHQHAADAVQDAFVALCRQSPEVSGERLAPWLYRAVRHRLIDQYRKERPMTTIAEHPSPPTDPAAPLVASEDHARLHTALATLSPRQQEVLHLKFQDGMRYQDIADALDLSPGTVAKTIHEAIARLRNHASLRMEA
ncbi:MAG: sigma-70 family RNA polymerase sigma factor [Planctomycetota bacterium]|nr:MAG: sigma-70 family RNA polymerase sigma factor [Planctomycetota bacterium]